MTFGQTQLGAIAQVGPAQCKEFWSAFASITCYIIVNDNNDQMIRWSDDDQILEDDDDGGELILISVSPCTMLGSPALHPSPDII